MTAGYTDEARAAIALCQRWAISLTAELPCEVYLFGSAIYDGGDQFDPQTSDIDLVVLFPESGNAVERLQWMQTLLIHKTALELQLIPQLHRRTCFEPTVSVVPITPYELRANIHKSAVRRFFDKNLYLNLLTGEEAFGIPGAGTATIADEHRQAIELVQKMRNEFLAVSANATGGIKDFDGPDPIPKGLARAAAQLDPNTSEGQWYDTRLGLELLFGDLASHRDEGDELRALYRKISMRRGGRGGRAEPTSLDAADQVLLAELLFDRASQAPQEPISDWAIRFTGTPDTQAERDRILGELRRLAPDAQIVEVRTGSILVLLRSSERSLDMVLKLSGLNVLPAFFAVSQVQVFRDWTNVLGGLTDGGRLFDVVASALVDWQPAQAATEMDFENSLATWLESLLRTRDEAQGASYQRDILLEQGPSALKVDFAITEKTLRGPERFFVELIRFTGRSTFLRRAERLFRLEAPIILVVIVSDAVDLNQVLTVSAKLNSLYPKLRLIPISLLT